MKILFISHEATRTGAPIALLSLLKNINEHHPDIQIETLLLSSGSLLNEFSKVGKIVCKWEIKKNLIDKIKIKFQLYNPEKKILKFLRSDYDLIYANTIASLEIAYKIKKALAIPLVFHCHESEYLLELFNAKALHINECNSIITVSNKSAATLQQKFNTDSQKIHIIPPSSFAFKHDSSVGKINYTKKKNDFYVGIVGQADWVKGVDLFPLVVQQMFKLHPNFHGKFVWVGNFDRTEELRIKYDVKKMGIDDNIIFTGAISDPTHLYQSFDIGLVLSREESFSLSTLELASLGKPIVAFKGTLGIGDILEMSNAILLSDYLDIKGICDNIFLLYSNQCLCKNSGELAKKIVSEYKQINGEDTIINLIHTFETVRTR